MPIGVIKLKGEKRLAALVARAFRIEGPDADVRTQRAEAALLRANPHLANLAALPRGTAILVPTDIGLEVGNDLESFDEIGKDLLDDLGRSLDLLERDLVANAGREVEEAQQTATIVKSRAFKAAFAQQPPAAVERAEEATANAKDQAARGKKLAADIGKAFAQLGKDLKGLDKRLG